MSTLRGRNFLMAPGPTNIPDRVLRAMQRPAVELSTPSFVDLCRSCVGDLEKIFKTTSRVFIYAANGHGAWEAALVNALSPGDRVLVPETGMFSALWSRMAKSLGIVPEPLPGDWRHAVDPNRVEERLRADSGHGLKALLLVHTDTATGITCNVQSVRAAIDAARHPALLMLDSVASLAATDLRTDEWGIDVALGASQKALMAPPGISFIAVSEKGLAAAGGSTFPRLYWDWHKRSSDQWYDWFCGTAPEHLVFALRAALDMIIEEGLDAVFARHQRLADMVRAAVRTWAEEGGVELNARLAAEQSNSVSTVRVNEPNLAHAINLLCRDQLNVSLGGGLGQLEGRAFRIAHMGDVNEPLILGALASVEAALELCAVPHGRGGVRAAIDSLTASLAGPGSLSTRAAGSPG